MQRRVLSGVPQGSVLGPLLFVIYISDSKYSLKSLFVMYADDLKIYNKSCNFIVLQNDLDMVANWSCTLLLRINSAKCLVLYTNSNRNLKHDYHVHGTQLSKVDSYRDLGVMVSSSLLWSDHIAELVKKANRIIFLISRTFRAITISMFNNLYKTLVRPVLEFANTVWAPSLKGDIALLEGVQRRATRLPFGRVRPSYEGRLALMHLPSLVDRRGRGAMITTFQALTNNNSVIRFFFKLDMRGRTRGNSFKLVKGNFKTTGRQIYIVNRVFGKWNSLPTEVVLNDSVLSFKGSYDQYNKV
ncbi:hypothetical protein Zmor_014330 [Zophobas morio]|uniref:Reverse transcriptase domain-containing protein n=1 Tax=Zophobas morio TaxID=2755281 RepID=A0AA38MGC7_9CUCU|nr:hypothetical protein Zmor_014330 [Zophobas morio]